MCFFWRDRCKERGICVFSVTSMLRHRNVVLQHAHTLTNTNTLTHTHTHTHDWPTVASRSSGSRGVFSGFANIFGPQVVSKNFLDRQGVTQHPKIFPECYKCFLLFMFIYVRRHYAARFI